MSPPRYPLPGRLSATQSAAIVADKNATAARRAVSSFPIERRFNPDGKGFSPEYNALLKLADEADRACTVARAGLAGEVKRWVGASGRV